MRKFVIPLILTACSFVLQSNGQMIPVLSDGKVGYIDTTGNVVVQPELSGDYILEEIHFAKGNFKFVNWDKNAYQSGSLDVFKGSTRMQHINIDLLAIMNNPRIINKFLSNTSGYYRIKDNISNREVKINDYDYIGPFIDGWAVARMPQFMGYYVYGYKYGYLNRNLKLIIRPDFDYANNFSEGFATIAINNLFGFIKTNGEFLVRPQFQNAFHFSDGMACVKVGKLYGFIDTTGKIVINPQFNMAFSFHDGLARFYENGYYGYMDKKGNKKISAIYEEAGDFSEGLAKVKSDGFYGFINTGGLMAIPADYKYVGDFSEGLAVAVTVSKVGFIDKTNRYVIPGDYSFAQSFNHGVAMVWRDNEAYYINKSGNIIWKFEF